MKNGKRGKVRCALIGAGWWATFAHIPSLLDHPAAELVAIQKRNYDEAIKVAKDFGIPHVFTSVDELVAMDGLDAVVVSSSVNMHFEHASASEGSARSSGKAHDCDAAPSFGPDGSRLDIYDTLNIELDGGCIASIASTGATSFRERNFEVRIFGTRAMLFLELWSGSMQLIPLNGEREVVYPNLSPAEIYPERAPAANLVDSVLNPAANLSPGLLGVAAMEVIEAACTSARCGQNVRVRDLLSPSL